MDPEEEQNDVESVPELPDEENLQDYERGVIYLRTLAFNILVDRRAIPLDDFQLQLPSNNHYLPLAAGPLNIPEATVAHDQVAQELLNQIESHIHPVHGRRIDASIAQIDLSSAVDDQISAANNALIQEVEQNPCIDITREVVGCSMYFFVKLLEKIVLDYAEKLGGYQTRVILEKCLEAFKQNVVRIVQRSGGWDAVMLRCMSRVTDNRLATFFAGVAIGAVLTICILKAISK